MLLSLHIENIAVVKKVDFDFTAGFMVLTGETGAGKSIIIDGINLLLGAKPQRELIRSGESSAMVSGLFGDLSDSMRGKLLELGVDLSDDGTILVQRTITQDGKGKITVNGRSVNLALLKSITPSLVNIHGQSDTAALVDSKNHIEILDVYAGCTELLNEYRAAYAELESIRHEIREITEKARESERLKEILEYQIKDIDSAALHSGEEEELVEKKVKIKNSEKITKNCDFVFRALKGSEKGSASYLLDRSATALSQLGDVVPNFSDYSERLRDILYQVEDIAEEVYAVLDDVDEDPTQTLNKIESRLDKISKLKRKYGLTVDEVLAFRERAYREYEMLENSDALLNSLQQKERASYKKALAIAETLHSTRKNAAESLEAKVKDTLEFLDMPKVVFFASIREGFDGEDKVLTRDGSDTVEFYISANLGADAQPLSKIASGGELSRIMLALKSVIADKDGIPTVIYDEIDAGVSGKTARKIGIKMLSLSKNTQIFCVTHSAQIASLGDVHFLISKSDVNGATETSVCELDIEGRIAELSRILGGIDITEAQRAAAVDMLKEREVYKK
ncbi:MAG: DNA repair protein RecN [Ruminococcaceae bacterium]|nr:DNA repair protein RecN [Oscillospiraceae bacterium]